MFSIMPLMPRGFIHLHTHSHYSLLSALPKIPELVAAAKAAGMNALALTDTANLYGAIEFYKECKAAGIKPILGLDIHIAHGKIEEADPSGFTPPRLTLLAESVAGYTNLIALVTGAHLGSTGAPRTDWDSLSTHKEGLIAILPSIGGELALAARGKDEERMKRAAAKYLSVFGQGNVFAEITKHPGLTGHEETMGVLREATGKLEIPLVAAHEVYYLAPSDRRAWETMRAIQNGRAAEQEFGDEDEDFSFIDSAKAEILFKDLPDALERGVEIAKRIDLTLELGKWVFPKLPIPEGATYDTELKRLAYEGLPHRKMEETEEVRTRIEYELEIIKTKGYAPYFLVVADLLRFARESGILTTTRGSAAGSLVSYLTGITNVDPLAFKMPFERFLNPHRPSAPDIDMDFADNRRDEVIEYARKRYGETQVAQIGTFGTMLARGVVRDVARALGYPYGLGDRIAKEIPMGSQGFPMTLNRALELSPDLAKIYKSEREAKEIVELGKSIEGCARHISVHAAGVVIAPMPLVNFVPLQRDPKGGKIITQYDMYAVEDVGLLKFDFLGIRNLAILAHAVKLAEKIRGANIDIENVPLDDEKTYQMLARGETEGLFQLNGSGMTRYLMELKPSSIYDINAMVALYRPGPMEMIPAYIERKHNPNLVTYLDPRMKEILDRSYGVITYQDDVLLIAVKLAGYSWLEADALRKAMGKKIPAEMEAQREKLISGAIQNGMTKEKAEHLWKLIEPFAAYGFNKAHAASYGKVAYQTAYMKANFPVEYMAAVLTAEAGDIDTVATMVNECKRLGIPVLPPSVNESLGDFTVILGTPDAVRFGLYSIKNFGQGIANSIIEERKEHGPYESLSDFLRRLSTKNGAASSGKTSLLNRRSLEALIECGALDGLGERGAMLGNIELLLEYHKSSSEERGMDSLFASAGAEDIKLSPMLEAPLEQKLIWEKELLGLYVSGHPLDKHMEKLKARSMNIAELKERLKPGMTGVVAGILEEVKPILTKGGDQMAFIKIADHSGSLEAVVFPKLFQEHKALLQGDACIAIKGRISERNGTLSLVAEAVKPL